MDDFFLACFIVSITGLIYGLYSPKFLKPVLKEKATRKYVATIFGVSTVFFFILFGISTDTDPNQQEKTTENSDETMTRVDPVPYEIVHSEDISNKAMGGKPLSSFSGQELDNLPWNKKMTFRVVVSPTITRDQVVSTAERIVLDITNKDNDIDEVIVWMFSDKELAGSMYDVAMATYAPYGELGNITPEIARNNTRDNYQLTLEITENLEEYLHQRYTPEEKFGMSEEKRREIFKEIVNVEQRAENEALKIHPYIKESDPSYFSAEIFDKYSVKEDELMKKYKQQFREKYKITEEIESEIISEAMNERWLME